MKIVLKNIEPTIRAYLGDAFCFSIIDDIAFQSGWIYDKYIHIEYTPADAHIKYADYDYYDFVPDQGVFIKSFIEYPNEHCTENIVCDVVKRMINNKEYCFALWNETIITNYLFGEKNDEVYEHGCFIYGYDDENRVFYSQGYIRNELWEHFTIPYSVFYKAVSYCKEKRECAFIGYKLVESYNWECNVDKMKFELSKYKDNFIKERGKNHYDANALLGFFHSLKEGEMIHYPSLYCLYEHKQIFARRLNYMYKRQLLKDMAAVEKGNNLVKLYRKLMLLGIKYNASMDSKLFQIICSVMKNAIEKEIDIIDYLL